MPWACIHAFQQAMGAFCAYSVAFFATFLRENLTHIFANFALLTHIFAEVADLCVK
jgi:hypothetical protein